MLQDSICSELVRRISQNGPAMHRATAVAAEVDCLVALALSAAQFNLRRPKLTTENILKIRKGDFFCPQPAIPAVRAWISRT